VKRFLALFVFYPALAFADYTGSGLEFEDGIEPGDPSVCEADAGALDTCFWVDCDRTSDQGLGTHAAPYWGFEPVFGYFNSSGSYVQGAARSGDYVYVKGTCEVTGSVASAAGPFKQIRIARANQGGSDALPTVIKSWRGTAKAVFDGEYDPTLTTFVTGADEPTSLISIVPTAAMGRVKFQNIRITRYHTNGFNIQDNALNTVLNSIEVDEGRVSATGGAGGISYKHDIVGTAAVHAVTNSYIHDNDHLCNTFVGDTDVTCTVTNNDGAFTIVGNASTTHADSTFNISNTLFENNTRHLHEKHNWKGTATYTSCLFDGGQQVLHKRGQHTVFVDSIIKNPSVLAVLMDSENQSAGIHLDMHNVDVYMTTGKFISETSTSSDPWTLNHGSITLYNVAVHSTSVTTPFIEMGVGSGTINDTFEAADFITDHNFFFVPADVQAVFSCFNDGVAGGNCINRTFAQTMSYNLDVTSAVTDPEFADPADDDFSINTDSPAATAGRSGLHLGPLTPDAAPISATNFGGLTVRLVP
jgi:hypothetical protein